MIRGIILKIEHIAMNVPEASSVAKWYVEHIGLSIIRDVGDANQTIFLADDNERTVLEIYTNPAAEIPDYHAIHPLILHIALSVEDMDSEKQRLLDAGAKLADELLVLPNGDQLLFMRDPYGIALQLAKRSQSLRKNET